MADEIVPGKSEFTPRQEQRMRRIGRRANLDNARLAQVDSAFEGQAAEDARTDAAARTRRGTIRYPQPGDD